MSSVNNYSQFLQEKYKKCQQDISQLKSYIKMNIDEDNETKIKNLKKLEIKFNNLWYCITTHENYLKNKKGDDSNISLKSDLILFAKIITMSNLSQFYENVVNVKQTELDKIIKINKEMKILTKIDPIEYNKKMSTIFSLLNLIISNDTVKKEINLNHKNLINKGEFIEKTPLLIKIENKDNIIKPSEVKIITEKIKNTDIKINQEKNKNNYLETKPNLEKNKNFKSNQNYKRDPRNDTQKERNPKVSRIKEYILGDKEISFSNDSDENSQEILQVNNTNNIEKISKVLDDVKSKEIISSDSDDDSFDEEFTQNENNLAIEDNKDSKDNNHYNNSYYNKITKKNFNKKNNNVNIIKKKNITNDQNGKVSFLTKKITENIYIQKLKQRQKK